jgi:phosphohistidine phosphatase
MKKLIFIRHGRAEDPAHEISDFERSLTLKGKAISKLMAGKLSEKVKSPGIIISSPAFRALETAIIFAKVFGIEPEEIILDSKLYYNMNFNHLREILSHLSDEYQSVAFFGHNPSFTELPDGLCREGCDSMPKSGIICISFNIKTWSEVRLKTGTIEYYLKPEKVL